MWCLLAVILMKGGKVGKCKKFFLFSFFMFIVNPFDVCVKQQLQVSKITSLAL